MSTCANQHMICLDMGTTNTRVWLLCGDEVVARATRPAGVKVAAKEGSTGQIATQLREMVAAVTIEAGDVHPPECIAAAGMITSGLGLKEIPHVITPAGLREIISASQWQHFHDVSDLPFLLVPGVCTFRNSSTEDVMRGEETLCLGMISSRVVTLPAIVLNLGSHWKAIEIDSNGRICSSVTSLSGELIDAACKQTVLASSLPGDFPDDLAWKWVEAGMTECRQAGLPRTLFRVRLLELRREGNAQDRLAFLVGAFIAADLDALVSHGMFVDKQVVLTGRRVIGECWRRALQQTAVHSSVLSIDDTERVFLKGLQQVLQGTRTEPSNAVVA